MAHIPLTIASAITKDQKRRLFSLYRKVHRATSQFSSFNFKEYFSRCSQQDFRKFLTSPISVELPIQPPGGCDIEASHEKCSMATSVRFEEFYKQMDDYLAMLNRQSIINRLYSQAVVLVTR